MYRPSVPVSPSYGKIYPRFSGPDRVGVGNYNPEDTYAGIPNEGGLLDNQPGFFGPMDPNIFPSLSRPPDPRTRYLYSPGADLYNAGISPTTYFGGLQRLSMNIVTDQYGTHRQGTSGFSYNNYPTGGGFSSYPASLGDKAGYFGNKNSLL